MGYDMAGGICQWYLTYPWIISGSFLWFHRINNPFLGML